MTGRVKSYLYCIPISTQQFSNVVTSRLVVIISTFTSLVTRLNFSIKHRRPMIYLLLFYVLFSFTDLRIFVVLTYTITLKLFCNKLFSYFLTLIHRLGYSYIHIVVNDTTSYWLACRPIRSQYEQPSPPITSPLCLVSEPREQ